MHYKTIDRIRITSPNRPIMFMQVIRLSSTKLKGHWSWFPLTLMVVLRCFSAQMGKNEDLHTVVVLSVLAPHLLLTFNIIMLLMFHLLLLIMEE